MSYCSCPPYHLAFLNPQMQCKVSYLYLSTVNLCSNVKTVYTFIPIPKILFLCNLLCFTHNSFILPHTLLRFNQKLIPNNSCAHTSFVLRPDFIFNCLINQADAANSPKTYIAITPWMMSSTFSVCQFLLEILYHYSSNISYIC